MCRALRRRHRQGIRRRRAEGGGHHGSKVKGKLVEVIYADHQNKPDVGVSIARNWYDDEKVDAIFDVPTSRSHCRFRP